MTAPSLICKYCKEKLSYGNNGGVRYKVWNWYGETGDSHNPGEGPEFCKNRHDGYTSHEPSHTSWSDRMVRSFHYTATDRNTFQVLDFMMRHHREDQWFDENDLRNVLYRMLGTHAEIWGTMSYPGPVSNDLHFKYIEAFRDCLEEVTPSDAKTCKPRILHRRYRWINHYQ